MADIIIEFLDMCNTASIEEVLEAIDGEGVELIFNNGYVTGISVGDYYLEA